MSIYRSEDKEKTIFDIFPTASELKERKEKERKVKILWDIFNELNEAETSSILWSDNLPEDCIDFLRKKGYLVERIPDILQLFSDDGECCYSISFE